MMIIILLTLLSHATISVEDNTTTNTQEIFGVDVSEINEKIRGMRYEVLNTFDITPGIMRSLEQRLQKVSNLEHDSIDPSGDSVDEINEKSKIDRELFQKWCDGKAIVRCENGGYPHPRFCWKCVCPGGYAGRRCTERPDEGCGKTIEASKNWKTLSNVLGNRTVRRVLEKYNKCNYWIQSPEGTEIEIKLKYFSKKFAVDGCPYAGVEIKTNKNQQLTGYRFCSPDAAGTRLRSHTNRVPIIIWNKIYLSKTILRYRYGNTIKDAIVLLRTIYWSLAAILIPCIIAIILLVITYVNLADDKPTQYGGVALGGISEPFTHGDVYVNLTDPEDSPTNSGDQQTDDESNGPNELASNVTVKRIIAFAKVLEDKIKLRIRPRFKYSYHIQRKTLGVTQLTIRSMEKGLLTVVYPDVFTMLESFVYMVTSCFLMILYLFLFEISSLEYFKCQLRSNKVQSMTSEPSSDNEQEFVDRAVFLDKVYKSWQTKESAISDVSFGAFYGQKTSKLDEKRKRLLTLAISMVGGSSLVLMDEPFKGLDAETKDHFRKILERNKEGRCFLVATSSAETAEMIGDRIVMLYNGRVLALGPIPSLKAELVVRKLVPTAELRLTCGKLVQFGFNSNNHEDRTDLDKLLFYVVLKEAKKFWEFRNITSQYARSWTCIAEEDQLEEETKIHRGMSFNKLSVLWQEISTEMVSSGKCPFARQFYVLLKKRLYLLPNRHCCLAVVTVPIVLVIFTVMSISNRGDADPTRCTFNASESSKKIDSVPSISLDMYDHGRFIIYDPNNMTEKACKVLENVLLHPNIEIIWTHSDNLCESWPNDWPFVVGAVAFGEDIGLAVVVDDEHDEIWFVPNIATFGYHTIIQEIVQGPWEKLHVDIEIAAVKSDSNGTSMLIIGIAHVILLSAFVIVPVQERSCNFKRQQILSGASVLTYWLAHFLFDALIAVITVSICLLLIVILHSAPSLLLS
ncbi:unnamed protein product [Haemonchus placei]|uniref:EGF-like domain-containing protein n=1 Tax=Haemonchus placei TaxID=6290 RepID=A0A158QQG5_HAEPC|nr:unnamed protein product [Haemonchus placei]